MIRLCARQRNSFRAIAFIALVLVGSFAVPQNTVESPRASVVLASLSPLMYPPMAHAAKVAGDVKVEVHVRPDGTVESAVALTGHPLLVNAALDNAKRSRFECRDCAETTPYTLTYTFQITGEKPDPCCCSRGASPENQPKISVVQDHITVTSGQFCVCPDSCGPPERYRSAKCLYLWRCKVRPEM